MRKTILSIFFCAFVAISAPAQTTAFTYQGSLKDGANPANGNYDFEFKLFDLVSGGAQQGLALQRLNVAVANGIFTVSLDFGAVTLPGADRFLDIAVRPAGGGAFTALTPRQQVRSSPYSVKSLNATTADSVTAGGIPAGSANYIQNTTSPQASSNFNISGTGTASIFSASTQYNTGSQHGLSQRTNGGLWVGRNTGGSNTGSLNVFVGDSSASQSSGTGGGNTFVGAVSGTNNLGGSNAFFGFRAGLSNATGSNNTMIGREANVGSDNLTFATAIGSDSVATQSNSVYLGRPAGEDTVRIPGAVIINGSLVVDTLGGTTGNVHLCRNTANRLALCTSNFSEKGETEALMALISEQQKQIEALKKLVCLSNKDAEICREK